MDKNKINKYLSYVWPVSKEYESPVSGTLEVSWINGKKLLDSEHANYSYGSLQKILDFALSKIDFDVEGNVLMLGLGGGCLLEVLHEKYDFKGKVTAVEIDDVVIDIANKEFDISNKYNVEIINADAHEYIFTCREKYSLILVDIFVDDRVPGDCFQGRYWLALARCTKTDGYVIFNTGLNYQKDDRVDVLTLNVGHKFAFKKLEKVMKTNLLLIGKKKKSVFNYVNIDN
jgi:spermidine synthase